MTTENPRRRIHQIRRAFLYMEAVAALLVLPAAARFSGDLLRRFAGVVASPRFVFLIGNAIVLLLFRSSGTLLSSAADAGDSVSDLLDHHVTPVEEKEDNATAVVSYEEEVIIFEESPELRREMAAEEEEEEEKSGNDDVDFQRKVEAFIERQLIFRRQETMKIEFPAMTEALEGAPLAI